MKTVGISIKNERIFAEDYDIPEKNLKILNLNKLKMKLSTAFFLLVTLVYPFVSTCF